MDEQISGKINRKGMASSDCNLVFFLKKYTLVMAFQEKKFSCGSFTSQADSGEL